MSIATRDRVLDVWEWCQEIYLQQGGVRLAFPGGTDPTKTYQYRYAKQLAERLTEWEFDEPTSRRFIEMAVSYAKDKGLLHKGMSLMCQKNLLDIAHKRLERDQVQVQTVLEGLERVHAWLTNRTNKGQAVDVLTARTNPDGYCNLVKWYGEQRLTDLYLSLSANCGRALARLARTHPIERQEMPDQSRLYLARLSFLQDKTNHREAKRILGGDWRQCP